MKSIISKLTSARARGSLDTGRKHILSDGVNDLNGTLGNHVSNLNDVCGIGNAGGFTRIVTLASTGTN